MQELLLENLYILLAAKERPTAAMSCRRLVRRPTHSTTMVLGARYHLYNSFIWTGVFFEILFVFVLYVFYDSW